MSELCPHCGKEKHEERFLCYKCFDLLYKFVEKNFPEQANTVWTKEDRDLFYGLFVRTERVKVQFT